MQDTTTRSLIEVNPASLIVGANVRPDARVDAALIESIRERGVLMPVTAYRNSDGDLVVLYGQRRTLASVQAERETIPVVVVPEPDEADRLTDQVTENDHRAALTDTERATAYDQLALLGMSAAQIAKATATKRETVTAALAVAKSETAREAIQNDGATLTEAAILAEFEDDEEAVTDLLRNRHWNGMEHTAQRLRDQRARAALIQETIDSLAADGITAIPRAEASYRQNLASLATPDGEPITDDMHADCPGHALTVTVETHTVYVDPETGEPVEDQEAAEAEMEAYYDARADEDDAAPAPYRTTSRKVAVTETICLDPDAHGHVSRFGHRTSTQPTGTSPAVDPEVEAEAKRAERRRVIQNNRAWEAAETVRVAWLKQFAVGKTAPKGAAKWLTMMLVKHPSVLAESRGWQNAQEIIGKTPADEQATKASDARALRLAVLVALTRCEGQADRDHWRNQRSTTRDYLTALAGWGYTLSDVERLAAGMPALDTENEQDGDSPDED